MLNEEKVVLMSQMAIDNKKDGNEISKMSKYFREDYIAVRIINTAIVGTLLFGMILAVYVFVNIEELLENVTTDNLMAIGRVVGLLYLGFIVLYCFFAWLFYSYVYRKSLYKIKRYDRNLDNLHKIIRKERKEKYKLMTEGNNNEAY